MIAITGASSFTGLWIARRLAEAGTDVRALVPRQPGEYAGLRALRVRLLEESVPVEFGTRAEDGGLERWIRAKRPEIWIHHHHFMEDFRSPRYDLARAVAVGLEPLPGIVRALAESGCRGIVFSGSYFEPGEGGNPPDAGATPYSKSKKAVWEAISGECAHHGLKLGKVVTPNPVGPFENEDRLVPVLIRNAREGKEIVIRGPESVSDQLPVGDLARSYEGVARALLAGRATVARPSGWIGTVREWVALVNRELVERRLGLKACPVRIVDEGGATRFRNTDPVKVDWDKAWDDYAFWLKARGA